CCVLCRGVGVVEAVKEVLKIIFVFMYFLVLRSGSVVEMRSRGRDCPHKNSPTPHHKYYRKLT
ncbi:MAG: hypothetical protein ACP5IZ_11600, partial [Thermoprotei archaeon]